MKQRLLWLVLSFLSIPAFAVYEVGDYVQNMCWKDEHDKSVCLDDAKNNVRVLLYNAGWCGPCNEEFDELAPRTKEFAGKPVTFISLSSAGWTGGSDPDAEFLKEWKEKHGIEFAVCGSPRDAGKKFTEPPIYIPNVAIVGKDGKLAYKAVAPGADAILEEVKRLLK